MILDCGESHYNIVKDIIELYLERDFWYLPIKIEDNPNTISIADVQKNVVQVCLMTEGLSQLVSSLHVANQNLCLIHCLYPILERVGSELGPVSLAGNILITHNCENNLVKLYLRSKSNNVNFSIWWIQ